jgi:hypothetical protein
MAAPSVLYERHAEVLKGVERLLSELGGEEQVAAARKVRIDAALSNVERYALSNTELILGLAQIVAQQHERIGALEALLESGPKKTATKAKADGKGVS